MFEMILGSLIYKTKMPKHEEIKEAFLPLMSEPGALGSSEKWDCNCETSLHHQDLNSKLPWDLFFGNIQEALGPYLQEITLKDEYKEKLFAYAWANRYLKGQHQEVHAHGGDGNIISCAYMLDLPQDLTEEQKADYGQFIFYNSSSCDFSPNHQHLFHQPDLWTQRHNPLLEDGDIVFFPSTLEHYVTWNKTDEVRSTISANFKVTDVVSVGVT